jgi:dTDP-4-amino-4,6-dideoxygalactose transaminase
MNWKIPLADLDYDHEEDEAVLEVLHSKWLTMGAVTQQFEAEFAAYHQAEQAVAVSNATQALHLALLALGVGPGDEVIVPSLSFVATANCVLYTGAEVRFADILSPLEPTIDPASVEAAITARTKAVICMHYGGYPCRMPALLALCERYHLHLVEDAAHSPGAWLEGRALGTWGDIGCFSFFSNKNLSTGEGGMLLTADAELAARLRLLRSHGMTSLTWDRHQGHAYSYDVVALGYNDRIDEIRAALGRVQLRKLGAMNGRRLELTLAYHHLLQDTSVELPFSCQLAVLKRDATAIGSWQSDSSLSAINHQPLTSSLPACHLMPILLPEGVERQEIISQLKAAGIQTSLHYPPIHQFSYYRERCPGVRLAVTEDYAAREVTLPLYPGMTEAMVGEVVGVLNKRIS